MPERPRRGLDPLVMGLAAAVAVLVVVAVAVVRFTSDGQPGDDPLGTPTPTPTEQPTAGPDPTAPPDDGETPEPDDDEDEDEDEERDPTDADAASFVASYNPPGGQFVQRIAVDVTGDGDKEIVFASVTADTARVDVAAWDGRAYQIVYIGEGGNAERLERFMVSDFTGDGRREIVTVQSVGARGESLSIWGFDGEVYRPQRGRGGCWNGSHNFGVVGADISPGEIVATCDGSPLPTAAWPSDVYTWDGEAWAHESTRSPGV